MTGPITALQTLDCDWFVHKFTEANFSKLTDQYILNIFYTSTVLVTSLLWKFYNDYFVISNLYKLY